jgi:lysophospholipase L1-like esterase
MDTASILCIGDSNGEMPEGWPTQLKVQMPKAHITNTCISGNTIGFFSDGTDRLNTLKNLNDYIATFKKQQQKEQPDYIVIQLGTNDTKEVFKDVQDSVVINMATLITQLQSKLPNARILVLSPPPFGDKFSEGATPIFLNSKPRMEILYRKLKDYCATQKITFIDTHKDLLLDMNAYFFDGIHFTKKGATLVAKAITHVIYHK